MDNGRDTKIVSTIACLDLLDDIVGLTQVLLLACSSPDLQDRAILDGEQRGITVIGMLIEYKVEIISKSIRYNKAV